MIDLRVSSARDACKGRWLEVRARDPQSVCCEPALFVTALRSLGVPLHPAMPFRVEHHTAEDAPFVLWRWIVGERSRTNAYTTQQLAQWWQDAAWLKANPAHEFAILRAGLMNHFVLASELRSAIPRIVARRGRVEAHIPANASPARKQWLIDQLEGRIPVGEKLVEPEGSAAT